MFAAGDVANAEHPLLGTGIRVEHWANALNQPRTAARAMLGLPASYDRLPYFFSDQYDLGMEYTGHVPPGGAATVVFRGDPATASSSPSGWPTGRVLAGMNVNVWDVTGPIGDLVRSGAARSRAAGRPRRPAVGRAGHRRLTTLPGVPEPGTHERGPARPGVPAARQVLALLQALARQPGAVPAAALARDLGLPRSTTYHLLAELVDAGFVVHLPEERRYGLGVSAFEIGSAYSRQEPLARLARPVLARLVDAVGNSAHLAVLHGREVLYVVEQRAPGRPPLVTDVGVRLPAQLTASGRAMLADLPPAQVRALFPDATAFVDRHGSGPARLSELRRLLADVRRAGHAGEDGEVTPGFASVAAAVHDHAGRPAASVAVTFPAEDVDGPAARGAGPPGRPRGGGADPADQRPPAGRLSRSVLGQPDRRDVGEHVARAGVVRMRSRRRGGAPRPTPR